MSFLFEHWSEDEDLQDGLEYGREEKTTGQRAFNVHSDDRVSAITKKLFEASVLENEKKMVALAELCGEVLPKYPQEKEYYHSVWHIIDMCRKLDDYAQRVRVSADDWTTLFLAILFHDVVYKVGASDNEDQSIVVAQRHLSVQPIKGVDVGEVCSLIEATKVSHSEFRTDSEKIIHDLDWSGFLNYATMGYNEGLIRNEAARDGFSDVEFYQGQLKFYQRASEMDIYKTEVFADHNARARRYILWRMDELKRLLSRNRTKKR